MDSIVRPKMLIGLGVVYACMALYKISFCAGMPFSWSCIALPLFGACLGLVGTTGLFIGFGIAKFIGLLCGVHFFSFLGLPTIGASCYWASEHKLVRCLLPAICMGLFVLHPVGYAAAPYVLYWFIPILIGFMPRVHSFLIALGSTFTAHAVGSVMHLYLVGSLSSQAWLELIPQVALERLALAAASWMLFVVLCRVCAYQTQLIARTMRGCSI